MRLKKLFIGLTVVAVLSVIGLRTVATDAATQTFGNTVVGSLTDDGDANYLNGSRFKTGTTGGTLTSMSAYVAAVGVAPNNKYQLAIYADSSNHPGALIAKSAQGTLTANSWNTLPITATIAPNTNYWLMYGTNGSDVNVNNMKYATGGTGGSNWPAGSAFGTTPNPFGTFGSNNFSFSIYGTYTVASATPPTVSLTAPTNGATVSGSSRAVSANASDAVSVSGVQFKLDGANLGAEDTTAPYSVNWNTTTATNGSHSLTAVARNGAALTTTSSTVTVTVNNAAPTPPTVSLTTPANNATVSGTTQAVSANASDAVGVAGVQFKLDGANLGAEDTTSPYSVVWNTTTASNASHTLTAVARNTSSLTTTSSAVAVTVSNVATPPTVAVTVPANNATVSGTTQTVSANASDAVSVSGVQFKLDGANLGAEDTTAPYAVTWDTTSASNASHTITAVARNASSLTTTSSTVTVTVSNAPAVPIGLTATAASTTQVNLSWTASSGATSYKVYRNGTLVGSPTTTTYQDTGLTAATSYNYTVSALNTFGLASAQSTAVVGTTNAQGTSQSFGNSTAGTLNDYGDANYLNGSRFTTGSTGGTLTSMSAYVGDIDAAPNNKYQLAIYADSGNAPGALIAQSAQGTLTGNSWNTLPISATITASTNYWLMYSTNSVNLAHNNLNYAEGGTGGSNYPTVTAFGTIPDPFGNFGVNPLAFTLYATYTGSGSSAPAAPTGLAATATSATQVDLSWTASSGATSYKVFRDGTLISSPSTTSFQDSGLTALTTYAYTVSAVNSSGESAQSSPVTVATLSSTQPNTIFFDDFLGTSVDSAKWDVYDRISDQANSELNCVTPANINVTDGILNGFTKYEDHTCGDSQQAPVLEHYTSWQIGQKAHAFKYGTVQVRAKEPGGTGIWPTIFLLAQNWQASQPFSANNPAASWDGTWSEIDIAEFWQNDRNNVNNTVHYTQPGGLHFAPLPYDATSRFMVYKLDWSPTALTFSVDAEDGAGFRTLRTITDPSSIPNTPMYLTINAAVGGYGGGTPDPNTFPQTFQIDWVRITQ